MIALTGDTRGIEALYQLGHNDVVCSMTKDDFLIVLGNCGISEAHTDFTENVALYRDLPCSVLYLDGPHDDYDLLSDYPLFPWNGGMTQNMSRYLTHLTRGQVFTLKGRTFFTMGGGTTPGRDDRGKYYDWWPEQDIFPEELNEADRNLSDHGYKVDYVLSCECPTSWKKEVQGVGTPCSDALEILRGRIDYGHWYFSDIFGRELPVEKATALHNQVIPLTL